MSGGVSSNEDFVFILSVVLLCLLFFQWIFVAFLFLWLRKIHLQATQAYKERNIFSKLNFAGLKQTATVENMTKGKSTYSIPLVISNKRATSENADTDKSPNWKNIDRTFAYAEADLVEDGATGSSTVEGEEDKNLIARSKTQGKEKLIHDKKDASDATLQDPKLNDNNAPGMLLLTGGCLHDDIGRKTVFKTLKGTQSSQVVISEKPQDRLVLVEAEIVPDGTVAGESRLTNKTHRFEDSGESNMAKVRNGKHLPLHDLKVRKKIDTDGIISGDRPPSEEKQLYQESSSGALGKRAPRFEDAPQKGLSSESKPKVKPKPTKAKLPKEKSKQVTLLGKPDEEGRKVLVVQRLSAKDQSEHYGRARTNASQSQRDVDAEKRCGEQLTQNYDCIGTSFSNRLDLGNKDTSKDIYETIDENTSGFSKKKSSSFYPQATCVNVIQNTEESGQDSAKRYDNPTEEGPFYVNIREVFDI